MSVIRAFIAIELSDELHRHLDQVMVELRRRLDETPIRWVPAENIHLTLKFLGDVSLPNVEMLTRMLQQVCSGQAPFEISAGGLGAFPNLRRAHTIWIGLTVPPQLAVIQHEIEVEAARLGYAREERQFSPHLTLGRVSRNAGSNDIHKIASVLESYKVGFLGVAQVDAICLFRSDLKPSGAVYTRLFTAPFLGH